MAVVRPSNSFPDAALEEPWTAYRTWAATARYYKNSIDFWNIWSLRLAVAGAFLGALGQQIMLMAPQDGHLSLLFRSPAIAGSALVALAVYFSSQALAGNREKMWLRSRSAAESLKSAVFLYRASVPPFDGVDRGAQLRMRAEKILSGVSDLPPRVPPPESVPVLDHLTVEKYIAARVDVSINWYQERALEFQGRSDRLRHYTFVLGAVAVLLSLASTIAAVAAWPAVVATVIASVTAFAKNQRYQSLLALYSATASRLGLLKGEWGQSGKMEEDVSGRSSFIQRCDETMALENGAWVAQWTEQPHDFSGAAAGG